MPARWSVHHLTEYLSEVSAQHDEAAAVRVAAERAAEALDAEVAAVAIDGRIDACFGFGREEPPTGLLAAGLAAGSLAVPRLGTVEVRCADLGRHIDGVLLIGRIDEPLAAEEQHMLHGMARMLGLALRGIRTLEAERARHRLVETLLEVQRAISGRQPLQDVLDTITAGASRLFGDAAVSLVLTDSGVPDVRLVASTHGPRVCADEAVRVVADTVTATGRDACSEGQGPDGDRALIAAPVIVDGDVAGTLAADLPAGADLAEQRVLLTAFAQQVSLALTDARMAEAMREAFHDPLTGLANRALFVDLLERAYAAEPCPVVLYLDLDGFKAVNDTHGHQAGDRLLTIVAARLAGCLRPGDTAARLGGDEFAVLLDAADTAAGVAIADRIIAAVREPIDLDGRTVFVAASVGVAQRQPSCPDAAALLGAADIAMYKAKRAGKGRAVVFEPAMRAAREERDAVQAELRDAIGTDAFTVLYQPVVHLGSGRTVAVEALLRWQSRVRGPVPPLDAVPIAEEAGVVRELGTWVLTESARAVMAWRATAPGLGLHVNVSARQVEAPSFPADVAAALDRTGLPGSALTVELTEAALMLDPEPVLANLTAVRRLGVRIAVDDFGTGYSSVSHLRRFPVDEIKIDRTLVDLLDRGPGDLALVRALVGLGRSLDLPTVAEGIETAAQLAALQRLGCRHGQGNHLAPPQTRDQLDATFAAAAHRYAAA